MATDRNGLEILRQDECFRLLAADPVGVGRVAIIEEDYPIVLPVNYIVDNETVVFRTDPGSKLHAALLNRNVSFEADLIQADWHRGWSVLIQGKAERVLDEERDRLATLGPRPWASGAKSYFVRVTPARTSGRRFIAQT
jgi:nitroimidazol reductase NimA-like FMN-containing flavoprotein (pyridoxamine 5'-phosphate oxidase superfamily)